MILPAKHPIRTDRVLCGLRKGKWDDLFYQPTRPMNAYAHP